MKTALTATLTFFSFAALSGTAMKIEGSCTGVLADATQVSFTYYSDFDGCQDKSRAAVTFNEGLGLDLHTGNRSFEGEKDIYRFSQEETEVVKLTFANSTGNTGGQLSYQDETGKMQALEVQCEIRDYHYGDCE